MLKRSLVNRKKYAAALPIMIKEFENTFQDCQKTQLFDIFASTFSVDINTLLVNFQMDCIELKPNVPGLLEDLS